jgi:hypothetical protein
MKNLRFELPANEKSLIFITPTLALQALVYQSQSHKYKIPDWGSK